jgi:Sec-independent protein translocase protein TatA
MSLLTLLVLVLLFAVIYLIIVAKRIERATASVAWALDAPRRELVALEDELEELRDLARSGQADEDDYKTMNEIEVKLARRRARQQHP